MNKTIVYTNLKGTVSRGIDKAGECAVKKYIKDTTTRWISSGVLTVGKYVTKPRVADTLAKHASIKVNVANIVFTSKYILTSESNKQYKGAALDLASGIAGVLIEAGIGVGVTILISAGAPVLLAGALGFGINVFISGKMDTFINKRKIIWELI